MLLNEGELQFLKEKRGRTVIAYPPGRMKVVVRSLRRGDLGLTRYEMGVKIPFPVTEGEGAGPESPP